MILEFLKQNTKAFVLLLQVSSLKNVSLIKWSRSKGFLKIYQLGLRVFKNEEDVSPYLKGRTDSALYHRVLTDIRENVERASLIRVLSSTMAACPYTDSPFCRRCYLP